jgi:drug/metabolite transporter (DMT)-like permease
VATIALTALALLAFAGNSILARLALGPGAIDPASYTAVRLVSGAAMLWLLTSFGARAAHVPRRGNWQGAVWLFVYAITFSFAYLNLTAGIGALILFAAVQFTMIAAGLCAGERPIFVEWLGWAFAVAGLIYLLSPGITAPSFIGSLLMTTAGIAWGLYSILGRGTEDPIATTASNFSKSVPLVLIVSAIQLPSLTLSWSGFLWAGLSGTVTSALGYVLWYAVLPRLSATRAATVQLGVPVIAAVGGVLFLAEQVTPRLLLAACAILGGIGLASLAPSISESFISGSNAARRFNEARGKEQP